MKTYFCVPNVSYVPCSFEHFSDESELTKVYDEPVGFRTETYLNNILLRNNPI